MDAKRRGFTLIEILVVVTIIGVLAGLVVVLIPKSQAEATKLECMNNIRQMLGLIEVQSATKYPKYGGPSLLLYLVKKKDLVGEKALEVLFCPGDVSNSYELAGGDPDAFKNLDLDKKGEYGDLTSYAGRNQWDKACFAKKGQMESIVLICDDSEDHHDGKGIVVGLTGGAIKWRHKFDDYEMNLDTPLSIGEGSAVDELQCLRAE